MEMKMRKIASGLVLVITAFALAACLPEKGTVYERKSEQKATCQDNGSNCTRYTLCVKGNPENGCGEVSKEVWDACSAGKKWPDCKGKE